MKLVKFISAACIALAFTACSDKDYVEIDSLQVFGDQFYKGETVNVGIAVNMSDPTVAEYYWECDGGRMVHRDGYVVNQWVAPNENGTYKIRCTVKCGGASQTREAEVVVSGFFFETFGNTTVSMNNSNAKATSTGGENGRYEVLPNKTSSNPIRIGKTWASDNRIYPPLSGNLDCGIIGNTRVNTYKPLYPVNAASFGFKTDNPCVLHFDGAAPSADVTTTYYIGSVRVEWFPQDHILASQNYLSIDDPVNEKTVMAGDFDALISFRWYKKANDATGERQTNGWFKMPFKCPELKYGADVTKNVGISIAEDYTVKFFVDGVEKLSWDDLKTWRASHDYAVFLNSAFQYIFPGKTACYVDNMWFYDDANFGK